MGHNCVEGFWKDSVSVLSAALNPPSVVGGCAPHFIHESTYASLLVLQRELERALGVPQGIIPPWVGGGAGLEDSDEARLRSLIHHVLRDLVNDQCNPAGPPMQHTLWAQSWMLTGQIETAPLDAQSLLRGNPPGVSPGSLLGKIRNALGST